MMRRWLVPGLWLLALAIPSLWIANSVMGWQTRAELESYFQQVIAEADHAGPDPYDASARICDRVTANQLNEMGLTVDRSPNQAPHLGGGPKPFDSWRIDEQQQSISACGAGPRHLEIEIDRQTGACIARVRLGHSDCNR